MKKLINAAKQLHWDLEIKCEHEKCIELRVLNEEIKQYELSDIVTYKIKAIVDNKTINLKTEDISDINFIVNEIKSSALLLDNEDKDFLARENIKGNNNERFKVNISEVRDTLIDLVRYKEQYDNLVNIDSIIDIYTNEICICNTDDIVLEDVIGSNHFYMNVSVRNDEKSSDSSDYQLFKSLSKEDIINLFKKLYIDANKRLNEESVKSNKYNIIIDNNAMFSILNTFKDSFLAKSINKGISLLNNSYEKQIFSPLINIVEDPLNENFPGKRLFDSEGTRCVFKKIIENGKFVNKLYDIRESIKDGFISTGNSDGVHNLYLVPGDKDFIELIKILDNGIVITDLSGLHSGVNTITGDMSLDARGYLVENGKLTTPLNSILLSANIFEVLNNVKYIGNDLKFSSTQVGSPSILCENIMIVGEK